MKLQQLRYIVEVVNHNLYMNILLSSYSEVPIL